MIWIHKKLHLEDLDKLYAEVIQTLPIEERISYCKRLIESINYDVSHGLKSKMSSRKILDALQRELNVLIEKSS